MLEAAMYRRIGASTSFGYASYRMSGTIRRRLRRLTAPGKIRVTKAAHPVRLFVVALIAFGLISLISYGEKKISPIVQTLAISRVTYIAERALNDAVIEQITESNVEYDDFVELTTNSAGEVTALKTNMLSVNRFKADVSVRVIEKLNQIDTSELSIPIGNIINAELFSGRGPHIRIKLVPTGSAETTVFSKFTSAGINQTLHQIMIEVNVYISVLLPYSNTGTTVTSQTGIAETVIVGTVPQSYTYLEDTGQSAYDLWGNFNNSD